MQKRHKLNLKSILRMVCKPICSSLHLVLKCTVNFPHFQVAEIGEVWSGFDPNLADTGYILTSLANRNPVIQTCDHKEFPDVLKNQAVVSFINEEKTYLFFFFLVKAGHQTIEHLRLNNRFKSLEEYFFIFIFFFTVY